MDLKIEGHPLYRVSEDDKVDAVIIGLKPNSFPQNKYDFLATNLEDFATPDEVKELSIGDAILSAGLLPGLAEWQTEGPIVF